MKSAPEQVVLAIDGDPFRYRAGFAAETPVYDVVAVYDDKPFRMRFSRTTKHTALENFNKWKDKHESAEIIDCTKSVKADPEEGAREMLRTQVDSVIKEVRQKYRIDRRDLRVDIYLSTGSNFRDTLAKLKPYKGNRDAKHKPVHFKAMTDELQKRYKIIDATGYEADDAVSIAAAQMAETGQRYVIATIDKDLDQIPGMHYDYLKKVFYEVSEEDGRRWFWQQVLSGDGTDNIGGACKIGPKRAETLIAVWENDWIVHEPDTDYDAYMWPKVVKAYGGASSAAGCYYAGAPNFTLVALENARLVYLQREPGELWTPPGMPKEFMKLEGEDLAS